MDGQTEWASEGKPKGTRVGETETALRDQEPAYVGTRKVDAAASSRVAPQKFSTLLSQHFCVGQKRIFVPK